MLPSGRASVTPEAMAAKRVKRTVCPLAPANSADGTATGAPRQRNCTSTRSSAALSDEHAKSSRRMRRMGEI